VVIGAPVGAEATCYLDSFRSQRSLASSSRIDYWRCGGGGLRWQFARPQLRRDNRASTACEALDAVDY
jgi:hypothetical protein